MNLATVFVKSLFYVHAESLYSMSTQKVFILCPRRKSLFYVHAESLLTACLTFMNDTHPNNQIFTLVAKHCFMFHKIDKCIMGKDKAHFVDLQAMLSVMGDCITIQKADIHFAHQAVCVTNYLLLH